MSHSIRNGHHTGETVSAFPRPNTFSEPKFGEPLGAASAMQSGDAGFDSWIGDQATPADAGVQSLGDFLIG